METCGNNTGIRENRRTSDRKFESPADADLSNCSIGAEAPAAAFGKTASADFASVGYKYEGKTMENKSIVFFCCFYPASAGAEQGAVISTARCLSCDNRHITG